MDLRRLYPPRAEGKRKGDYGTVLVAGGSDRYAGAPAFNALAALKSGADLAIVVAPRRAADLVAGYAPDLITVPSDLAWPDPTLALEYAARADVLVMGGGIERTDGAHDAIRNLVQRWEKPMVLDAEALRTVNMEHVQGRPVLLTPHGGEFEALTGHKWPSAEDARRRVLQETAAAWGCTFIVKGARDLVSDGTRVHEDPHGSPYMTKGGYGDLLAGVAATIMARGHPPFDAAAGAAALVGRAGALAANRLREATLASDALDAFAEALDELVH